MNEDRTKMGVWAGACAAGSLTILYISIFFNRFAGLRSGDGEFAGGHALIRGLLPFRDYFTASPPLNQFKAGLLLEVFGDKLIVLRTAGMLERGSIAVVLYFWLLRLRLVRPAQAVAITVATMIISTADLTDPIASYNHDALFAAILSGFLLSFVISVGQSLRRQLVFAALAGFAASSSFLVKQTIGAGALVIAPVVAAIIISRVSGIRRVLGAAGAFIAGAVVPFCLLLLWLGRLGVLANFWLAVFVQGPAAKASSGGFDFIWRAVQLTKENFSLRMEFGLSILALLLAVLLFRGLRLGIQGADLRRTPLRELSLVVAGSLVAILLGGWASYTHFHYPHAYWNDRYIFAMAIELVASFLFGVWAVVTNSLDEARIQLFVFAATCFSNALMLSLSFPYFPALLLPGFAWLCLGALAGTRDWVQKIAYAILVLFCADAVRYKFDAPFGFDLVRDGSVFTATGKSNQPKLAGMRLPPETIHFLDDTAKIVAENTTSSDTIFVYPEFSLLYTLTDRRYPTVSGSHNIDVVNDTMARDEAARLLKNPPKVIIFSPETEEYMRAEEAVWRHGHRAGQRDLLAAVEQLSSTYQLVGVYRTLPSNQPISVFVRKPIASR